MDLPPVMKLTLTGRGNEHYVGTLYLHNASIHQLQQQQQQQPPQPQLFDTEDRIVDPHLPGSRDYGISYHYNGGAHGLQPRSHPVIGGGHGGGSEKYFPPRINDPTGATYYVVAVVLVYGFSIVLLIASHIKRKNAKALEDRQINKYLQEFQVVRETSSRDRYRKLKRDITAKLDRKPGPSMGINTVVVGGGSAIGGNGGGGAAGNPYVAYRTLTKAALLPLTAIALPTIKETPASISAKRTLSDPQPPRCSSALGSVLAPPNPHLPSPAVIINGPGAGNGYGNAVRPCQRPWAAALPMRSWRSDDSHFTVRMLDAGMEGRRSTTGDMEAKQGRQNRAASESEESVGLDATEPRPTKVYVRTLQTGRTPSTATIASPEATVIPIIISAPDETPTGNRSSSVDDDCSTSASAMLLQQQSPHRRSSCPNPLLIRGVVPFSFPVSSSSVDERPFSASSLHVAAPSSSRRPSLQYSASVSRKRRRENWLDAHNELQQQKKDTQYGSCTLYHQQQLQLQPPNSRFSQRRLSMQSQLSCDGVIDEEPEVAVVVTSSNADATNRPQHRLLTATIAPSLIGTEYRRKSTSAIGDGSPSSSTAVVATIASCRTTATLDVPDPFYVVRTSTSLVASDAGASSPRSLLDRDSGMSITTGSALSVASQ